MRKWLTFAPSSSKDVWFFVNGVVPTMSGAYVPMGIWAEQVGSGPATPGTTLKAWCAQLLDGTIVGYVGTTTKLYTYDGNTTFTDKSVAGGYTNTAVGWDFAQYGNITIACNRIDATQFRDASGSSAFAALSGAPKAKIAAMQSNAFLLFNTDTSADGWATSDVGDYTNWSTGESASARLIATPGPITAAISFQDHVLVFKRDAVYRLRYVGGSIKWTTEVLCTSRGAWGKSDAIVCGDVVIFNGPGGSWLYDGGQFRYLTDYLGEIVRDTTTKGAVYCPQSRNVFFWHDDSGYSVYNFTSDRWGRSDFGVTASALVVTLGTHYTPITGTPGALNTFIGAPGVTSTTINGAWLVDLAATSAVIKNNVLWGNGSVGVNATVVGSIEGVGARNVTNFLGLDVVYSASLSSLSTASDVSPGSTEARLYAYAGDVPDSLNLNALANVTTVVTNIASSSTQRRFDFSFASPYARFAIVLPDSSGFTEIEDYTLIAGPGGKL